MIGWLYKQIWGECDTHLWQVIGKHPAGEYRRGNKQIMVRMQCYKCGDTYEIFIEDDAA